MNNRQEPETSDSGPGMEPPLWLLQKDDTRFLYLSLLLSVTVHIILFAVMAATRIFHPFAGASREFDLVWFSPQPTAAPMEPASAKPSFAGAGKIRKAVQAPPVPSKPSTEPSPKAKTPPTPAAAPKTLPANGKTEAPRGTTPLQTPEKALAEEPPEMVISRFEGKVVEVVDKKTTTPTFTVISSVKVKSEMSRAVVQTIRETGKETPKTQEVKQKTITSEVSLVASLPKEGPAGKKEGAVSVAPAPTGQTGRKQEIVSDKPIQGTASSSTKAAASRQPIAYPAVNRSINSLAAALEALSASGATLAERERTTQRPANGSAGKEKVSSLQSPSEEKPPARPPTVEKPATTAEKAVPRQARPPQLILHPPLSGDLKLVITGDANMKVEAFFRPYPKSRRNKPFTRREAENRRSVLPMMVRTGEKVHEAVVEHAEEGIYTIVVKTENGEPVTAGFVLKIRESGPGSSTKKLGSRKISGMTEVAKVLMPEGILWDDDKYFTGDMEDSDSITKFNSGTGLMWREYK